MGFDIDVSDVNSVVFHKLVSFLNLKASIKAKIASKRFVVNIQGLTRAFLEAAGAIIAAPTQPADKLTNKSEKIFNQMRSEGFIKNKYSKLEDYIGRNEKTEKYPPTPRLRRGKAISISSNTCF